MCFVRANVGSMVSKGGVDHMEPKGPKSAPTESYLETQDVFS